MEFILISWNERNWLIETVTQSQFLTTVACFPHSQCPDVATFPALLESHLNTIADLDVDPSYVMEDITDVLAGLDDPKSTRGVYVPEVGLFIVIDKTRFWPRRKS